MKGPGGKARGYLATGGLMLLAYLFGVVVRLYWIYWASGFSRFFWKGTLLINTGDGYYWGSIVRNALSGMPGDNPRLPDVWDQAITALSYLAVRFLHLDLETVMLYLPVVTAPLLAVPLILIGRLYGMQLAGFLAALLAVSGWSYYNRTMAGYYDTDIFAVTLPLVVVWMMLASIRRRSLGYALAASATLMLYPWFYASAKAMMLALSLLYGFGLLWRYRRERWAVGAVILIAIAVSSLPLVVKTILLVACYGCVRKTAVFSSPNTLFWIALLSLGVSWAAGDLAEHLYRGVMGYFVQGKVTEGGGLHYLGVLKTVREAEGIDWKSMALRISGSLPVFVFSVAGYLLLLRRHREFALTLPMMLLGIFAVWGGLRFTVYAVPVAALGFVYFLSRLFEGYRFRRAVMLAGTAAALYPNLMHVAALKKPPVLLRQEVEILERLATRGSERDYVISWWDFGYPLWFYSHKNTLIDGGKHQNDNFVVSEILMTDSQLEAARLSRLAVETYLSSGYRVVADTLFAGGEDPHRFLDRLGREEAFPLPKKSREIYLYLPWKITLAFHTVHRFSNRDLNTGRPLYQSVFYPLRPIGKKGGWILMEGGVAFDPVRGVVRSGKRRATLRRFVLVKRGKDGETSVRTDRLHPRGTLNLIYLKHYRRFLLVDERTYHSLYVQLFFLRHYDPKLFEPVIQSPWATVYRLKL